jgi:hypothetical protein
MRLIDRSRAATPFDPIISELLCHVCGISKCPLSKGRSMLGPVVTIPESSGWHCCEIFSEGPTGAGSIHAPACLPR